MPTEEQLQNRIFDANVRESALTANDIQPQERLILPEPQPSAAPPQPNLTPQINLLEKQIGTLLQPQAAETQLAREQEILNDLLGQGGRADFRAQASEVAGLGAKREALTAAQAKLTQLQAEADTLEERLQADVRGRGVTEGGLRPTRTAAQRDLAVRQRFAAADALVAQGDYASAKEQVNLAVEDEFADRQDLITAQTQQVNFLRDKIDRGEVRANRALNIALEERSRLLKQQQDEIDTQKETRKSIADLTLTARQFGADDATVSAIQNAKTMEEAILAAGDSLADPRVQAQVDQMRANIANVNDQIRSRQYADLISKKTGTEISPLVFQGTADDELLSELSEAITKVKLNATEAKAATFAMRMIAANKKINQLIGEGRNLKGEYDPTTVSAAIGRLAGTTSANTLDANMRDFIGAALRFESGAAIPDTEIKSGERIYSPAKVRITDGEIQQFTERRKNAILAMIASTGDAGIHIKQFLEATGDGLQSNDAEGDFYEQFSNQTTEPFNPNLF